MGAEMNKKGAFAHYELVAKNHVWSWSACDQDRRLMAMTFWEDEFEDDGSYCDRRPPHPWAGKEPASPGNAERLRHLAWAKAEKIDIKVILVTAKDPLQFPHRVAPERTMRVAELDDNGHFRLVPSATPSR
jgi:hypothetical protein